MSHLITLRSATGADLPEIVDLIVAQQTRQGRCDLRLPQVQTRAQWEAALREGSQQEALVALDEEDHVRGYARPGVWEIKPTSILRAFLTARNGILSTLTLPDPIDEDAGAVVMSNSFAACATPALKASNISGFHPAAYQVNRTTSEKPAPAASSDDPTSSRAGSASGWPWRARSSCSPT